MSDNWLCSLKCLFFGEGWPHSNNGHGSLVNITTSPMTGNLIQESSLLKFYLLRSTFIARSSPHYCYTLPPCQWGNGWPTVSELDMRERRDTTLWWTCYSTSPWVGDGQPITRGEGKDKKIKLKCTVITHVLMFSGHNMFIMFRMTEYITDI